MDTCDRPETPYAAPEKAPLAAFLDWQRATLLCQLVGLDNEQRRQPHVPSGLTLLGLVKHLADIERSWFREVFAGEELSAHWGDNDPHRYFRIEPEDTTSSSWRSTGGRWTGRGRTLRRRNSATRRGRRARTWPV